MDIIFVATLFVPMALGDALGIVCHPYGRSPLSRKGTDKGNRPKLPSSPGGLPHHVYSVNNRWWKDTLVG